MSTLQSKHNEYNLRLTKSFDYWWDVLMGGLLTSLILISVSKLVLLKLDLNAWFYPVAFLSLIIVAFYQWHDDNFTIIQTGLSKSRNFKLVTTCLDELDWKYHKTSTSIDPTLNKFLLKFLSPTIIPTGEEILINFQYHSTSMTGRLPFFFGISTYLEWRFKRTIRKSLARIDHLNEIDPNEQRQDEEVTA
jgi:hypothetical protein